MNGTRSMPQRRQWFSRSLICTGTRKIWQAYNWFWRSNKTRTACSLIGLPKNLHSLGMWLISWTWYWQKVANNQLWQHAFVDDEALSNLYHIIFGKMFLMTWKGFRAIWKNLNSEYKATFSHFTLSETMHPIPMISVMVKKTFTIYKSIWSPCLTKFPPWLQIYQRRSSWKVSKLEINFLPHPAHPASAIMKMVVRL